MREDEIILKFVSRKQAVKSPNVVQSEVCVIVLTYLQVSQLLARLHVSVS